MGVINNLILIRKIIGRNWDGTSISEIVNLRPKMVFEEQPTDTSGASTGIRLNMIGYTWSLKKKEGNEWVTAASGNSLSSSSASISLSSISSTSLCRVDVYGYGMSKYNFVMSNEFTVTRTAAQTASAKQNMSESLETDVIKEDLTTDETPVVEKTTTTKKGN